MHVAPRSRSRPLSGLLEQAASLQLRRVSRQSGCRCAGLLAGIRRVTPGLPAGTLVGRSRSLAALCLVLALAACDSDDGGGMTSLTDPGMPTTGLAACIQVADRVESFGSSGRGRRVFLDVTNNCSRAYWVTARWSLSNGALASVCSGNELSYAYINRYRYDSGLVEPGDSDTLIECLLHEPNTSPRIVREARSCITCLASNFTACCFD